MNEVSPGAGSAQEPAPAVLRRGPGTLWLLRHGETGWSRAGRHTGRTDVPLTERGRAQATALRPVLAGRPFALALSSPRTRAVDTARLAGMSAGTDPDLAEWDYGEYEGRTTPEIRRDHPDWTIWTGDPPGGETAAEVSGRADRVLARVGAALADGDVLVVCHGHLGRALAARWLGMPVGGGALLALAPAAPCVLGSEHGSPVIRHWNLPNPLDPPLR